MTTMNKCVNCDISEANARWLKKNKHGEYWCDNCIMGCVWSGKMDQMHQNT